MWLTESKEYKEKLDRIYKEEPQKFKEKRWKYEVPTDLARRFAKQINSDTPDYEKIREVLKEIISFVRDKVGEDDFFEEDLIEDLDWADLDTEETVDYYIDEMYDVLDGYDVWMEPASFFDTDEDEEIESEEESFDESCNKMKESGDSFEDICDLFSDALKDWDEPGQKVNNVIKKFGREVLTACKIEDVEALKKITLDYSFLQEAVPPLYDALINFLKQKKFDEFCNKMKESEEKFVIQYYDVNRDNWYAGDPEEGSYVTEDSWTKDPKEALLFDTEEEALAFLEDIDEHLLHNDPEYPSFNMRVVPFKKEDSLVDESEKLADIIMILKELDLGPEYVEKVKLIADKANMSFKDAAEALKIALEI